MSGSSAKPELAEETLSNPLQSLEKGSESNGKESWSPRLQPRYPGVERKSMMRFKDLPEDIDSPIIGRKPSRRSLLPTPASSAAPDARSTPFSIAEEEEGTDTNKSLTRRGLDLRPRRLQRSEASETTTAGSTPFSSSLIDVATPYIDPQSPPSLEEKPEVQKPLLNCTEVHNIKHKWTEPLTYRRDNYAHFLSEDCEPTNAIAKLLVATERLDLQDTWESRPKRGQVLVTPHGQHKTYSIVVKKRHFDEIDWKDVTQGLKNLQLTIRHDKQTTLRIANLGDLLGSLTQNKMTDILSEIFRGGDITVTFATGRFRFHLLK